MVAVLVVCFSRLPESVKVKCELYECHVYTAELNWIRSMAWAWILDHTWLLKFKIVQESDINQTKRQARGGKCSEPANQLLEGVHILLAAWLALCPTTPDSTPRAESLLYQIIVSVDGKGSRDCRARDACAKSKLYRSKLQDVEDSGR